MLRSGSSITKSPKKIDVSVIVADAEPEVSEITLQGIIYQDSHRTMRYKIAMFAMQIYLLEQKLRCMNNSWLATLDL